MLNAWTRFDNVYGGLGESDSGGARPVGALFSAENLGTRELASLVPVENDLRALTGNTSLRVDVGRLVSTADSRIVTTPLSLEYGVTNWLTFGVMVPVVQTHSTVFIELNPRAETNAANVGPNPALLGLPSARLLNATLIDELQDAQSSLQGFLASCGATPGSCTPETVARATSALARATAYEGAITRVYGTTTEGSRFVPLGGSTEQAAVVAALTSLQSDVNAVLGANQFTFGPPAAANGRAALQQLQQITTDPAGIAFDSLGSPDRIGIGDVEVSAAMRLFDGFGDTLGRGVRARAALRGLVRLGTGRVSDGRVPFEIGTGTGQTSADVGALLDLGLGRVMTSFAGNYTAYFGTAKALRVSSDEFGIFPLDAPRSGRWRAGNALQVDATPRILLTDYFSVHGHYTLRLQAASRFTSPSLETPPLFESSTEQRAGVGIAYSTLARYARGRTSVPIELFFSHLQTIAAHGGLTPQIARAQIELRIYYRLRRGAR